MEVDNNKELEILRNSYNMYERTKKETQREMKNALDEHGNKKYTKEEIADRIRLIEEAESDVIEKYVSLGGNKEDLGEKKRKVNKSIKVEANTVEPKINLPDNSVSDSTTLYNVKKNETDIEKEYTPAKFEYNPQASYDVIPLPSKGECYRSKMGKIPVAYLTAYDENMIIAPNLYRDNKIIDMILKEKVVDNRIDTYDMLEGDREAIILFLRASGYGNEYPITARDNETGIEFDTVIDLSKLEFKPFNLKGDENGWFDFTLPVSKKEIKFRFLTHKDNVLLKEEDESENKGEVKGKLKEYVERMETFIDDDDTLDKAGKLKVRQALKTIEDWGEGIEEEEVAFTHNLTNRLSLSIMAVDGVTDRKIVNDFVRNMNVRDSSALRKYITDNEPGIDYNISIERPETLGGGSMNVFLQLDQFIFLNIAQ